MPAREHGRPNLLTGANSDIQRLAGSLRLGGGGAGGGGGPSGFGVCTIGESGFQRGYFENNADPPVPLFGAITNNNPVPPVGSLRLRAITQSTFGSANNTWQIRITPAIFVQSDWTSCAISGLNGGITLLSANATFTANSFGASLWSFAATIDVWTGLSAGSEQTYEFA